MATNPFARAGIANGFLSNPIKNSNNDGGGDDENNNGGGGDNKFKRDNGGGGGGSGRGLLGLVGGGSGSSISIDEESRFLSNNFKKQKTLGQGSEKEVDTMLANALMQLKYEDRTKVEEQIHGIGQEFEEVVETKESIRQALQQFDTLLRRKYETAGPSHPDFEGYNLAVQNQWNYVLSTGLESKHTNCCSSRSHDENFRLRFIRTERFNIEKAVDRFLAHLNIRLMFYGPDSLRRPLELDDLRYDATTGRKEVSSRAYKYCKTGSMQVLNGRDRAGRRVVFHHCDPKGQTFLDECRVITYVHTVISDDEHVQRKGIVSIGILPTNATAAVMHYSDAQLFKTGLIAQAMRYSATHLCLSTSSDFAYKTAKQLLDGMGSQNMCQTRIHQNSSILELQYKLLQFGLPVEDENFPLTSGSVIKNKNHLAWMKSRQNIDELRNSEGSVSCTVVECPEPRDVLFSHNHKRDKRQDGNQEFERLVQMYHNEFESAPNRSQQREKIVHKIVEDIDVSWKGRFLVWNQDKLWWDHFPPNPDDPMGEKGFKFSNSSLAAKIRKKFFEKSRKLERGGGM
mmetsp:Transcript_57958/g.141601  ORF Transcript_57958/g.141601 Transcript_57958/m.141601 type:complete len:569 (-) Transcript_57958:48-1754(-)